VKAENMNIQHVIRLLKVANNDLPSVENRLQELEREEDDLKYRNERAARTVQEISNRISGERQILDQFRLFVKQQQQEVERLYSEKKGLEDIVERFRNNDETYATIKEMVKEQIESVLASPRQLLRLALVSMIESSRKNPSMFQALHYNMPSTRAVILQRSFLRSDDNREEQHPNRVCE
jgi:chromosome segregation ATPase